MEMLQGQIDNDLLEAMIKASTELSLNDMKAQQAMAAAELKKLQEEQRKAQSLAREMKIVQTKAKYKDLSSQRAVEVCVNAFLVDEFVSRYFSFSTCSTSSSTLRTWRRALLPSRWERCRTSRTPPPPTPSGS